MSTAAAAPGTDPFALRQLYQPLRVVDVCDALESDIVDADAEPLCKLAAEIVGKAMRLAGCICHHRGRAARIDADVVQLDEANLPGHPEEWEWAAAVDNLVLDAIPGTAAVHLCFGNYGGQTIQHGSWKALLDHL